MREGERMTERNQIGCAFGGHDSGQPRRLKRVALRRAMLADSRYGFGRHQDTRAGHGAAHRDRLRRCVNHLHATFFVQMRKTFHNERVNLKRVEK
jgi:hypothetical protein